MILLPKHFIAVALTYAEDLSNTFTYTYASSPIPQLKVEEASQIIRLIAAS